ncbi:hypothetical protein PNOK_0817100 [Pyrrhoderma noxium]|uniref:Uncharacterized protein n=1 Tax=Pyrrhoderma noxium TaxID=2282107 RepID=A0A286UAE3_9AGAM|nr:hypothetical protein PNOK_0817100 [Pyrrhoderma noxium]
MSNHESTLAKTYHSSLLISISVLWLPRLFWRAAYKLSHHSLSTSIHSLPLSLPLSKLSRTMFHRVLLFLPALFVLSSALHIPRDTHKSGSSGEKISLRGLDAGFFLSDPIEGICSEIKVSC